MFHQHEKTDKKFRFQAPKYSKKFPRTHQLSSPNWGCVCAGRAQYRNLNLTVRMCCTCAREETRVRVNIMRKCTRNSKSAHVHGRKPGCT